MKKRKSKFANVVVTLKMVEKKTKQHNFWLAFEKLCGRLGKTKEFFWYVRNRDVNATKETKRAFIDKITRLLAFNYDVHRSPDPVLNKRLYGDEPLIYPPEWKEEKPA